MIHEHERVILTEDLPDYHLTAGDVGVVVMIHGQGEGYEIEFFTLTGHTLEVVTVRAHQVRPVTEREVLHARSL